MKKLILLTSALIFMMTLSLRAQNYSELKDINLKDSVHCLTAQNKVLECCNYLLTNPCTENIKCLNAGNFIVEWMGATPNYTFSLEENFYKVIKSDLNLTTRYYAALAKTAIENNYKTNSLELQLKTITTCIEYCEKPLYKVNITKKIQKYIEAKNDNKLKDLIVIK